MPVTRKLAAVVIADVVGYSRLMEHDEAGTHTRLREIREKLIDPKIAEHGGRTVNTSGDGMLLDFPSATSALRCAVEIQREMGLRNLHVAPDERIEFRFGINLGDIIIEGDDIIGDGVNVAARLEALAEPGGISVSSAVREQVHEDLGVEFIDSGEQHVKNISKPIRVFRVVLSRGPAAKASVAVPIPAKALGHNNGRRIAMVGCVVVALAIICIGAWQWMARLGPSGSAAVAGPPPKSIMVLPFSAPAGDATLETLADTLSTDMTRALANSIRDAKIAPASVAADYKGKPIDARVVGHEVNVRYLLEGEVRATGDDIGVTVRLTDTMLAKELASELQSVARSRLTQDRDHLVYRLASATRLMFENAEDRRLASEPLSATDAGGLVQRAGATFAAGRNLASARVARKLYGEAIGRDPTLVAAWVGRAETLNFEHWHDLAAGRNEEVLLEQDRDTHRAIMLDARDAQAWNARADALSNQWRYDAAFEANDRARALDPTWFWLLIERGLLFIATGRSAEALAVNEAHNAMAGSPASGFPLLPCDAQIQLGHYAEAIAQCGRALAVNNDYWVYLDLTAAYAQTGDMIQAEAAKAELMRRAPDFTIARLEAKQFSNHPVWVEAIRSKVIPGLRKAGVPE